MICETAHIPKYERIKNGLIANILSGELKIGEKLPVRLELVKRYGVTKNTIDRALNDLIADNILTASRRKGTFVAATPESLKRVAILTWRSSVFQHSYLFDDRYSFFAMYGRLMRLLENRRYEMMDVSEALDNPAVLDDFDAVFIQPTSEAELNRVTEAMKSKDKITLLNREFPGFKSVSVNHYEATREVTEMYLRNLPSARIYFVGCENDLVVNERKRGFIDACEAHRKFYRLLEFVKVDDEKCFFENVKQIEIPMKEPVVVVSSSHRTTAIVMRYAAESGLKYNENFFYSDFDNENPMTTCGYPVTSVLEDYAAVAELAVRSLAPDFSQEKRHAPYKIINRPFQH